MVLRPPRSNESRLRPKSFLLVARTGVPCPSQRSAFTATGMFHLAKTLAKFNIHITFYKHFFLTLPYLFTHSACDRKPSPGFKPLTPPSTPVSPCGTSTPGKHALREQTPPLHPHGPSPAPRSVHTQQPTNQQALPSLPFAVPCLPLNQDANNFSPEHRWAS